MPGPLNDFIDVLFALSNELLKIIGSFILSDICFISDAIFNE
jgi:hypothetical protein